MIKAVILAAGSGNRLKEITKTTHKAMIEVGGTSLIHHQIKACLENGVTEFVFVLGYQKDVMVQHIKEILPPANFTIVENPIYDRTNTLYSLYLTKDILDDVFLYFNADVLFHPEMLSKIVNVAPYSQLLVEEKSCGEEEVKVRLEGNKIVEIGKLIDPALCAGEFIGVAKFAQKDLPAFFKHIEYGISQKQENNYFEYAVNLLTHDSDLISVSTEGMPCIEIDFPADLEKAKTIVYPQIKALKF